MWYGHMVAITAGLGSEENKKKMHRVMQEIRRGEERRRGWYKRKLTISRNRNNRRGYFWKESQANNITLAWQDEDYMSGKAKTEHLSGGEERQ